VLRECPIVFESGNVLRGQLGQFPDDVAHTELHVREVVGVVDDEAAPMVFTSLSFPSLSMLIV
jgi:hypothetical protein